MTEGTESIQELAKKVEIQATEGTVEAFGHDDWRSKGFAWTVRLSYSGRTMTVPFYMGAAHVTKGGRWPGKPVPPTAADVLDCLMSDASFAINCSDEFDMADELGGAVTRESRETWRKIVQQTNAVRSMLGSDFDRFYNAERM